MLCGEGNVLFAFNDTLIGGSDGDTLIGDFAAETPERTTILVEGKTGNSISAFRDNLSGGLGSDQLFGDGNFSFSDHLSLHLSVSGGFAGRAYLFADTIAGGAGDDHIEGGFGADVLSGGAGADHFSWRTDDFLDVRTGRTDGKPPVDTIIDFDTGDQLDLTPLALNQPIDQILHLRGADDDTYVAIDRDGTVGGASFQDFVVLRDFITGSTIEELHDQGVILV